MRKLFKEIGLAGLLATTTLGTIAFGEELGGKNIPITQPPQSEVTPNTPQTFESETREAAKVILPPIHIGLSNPNFAENKTVIWTMPARSIVRTLAEQVGEKLVHAAGMAAYERAQHPHQQPIRLEPDKTPTYTPLIPDKTDDYYSRLDGPTKILEDGLRKMRDIATVSPDKKNNSSKSAHNSRETNQKYPILAPPQPRNVRVIAEITYIHSLKPVERQHAMDVLTAKMALDPSPLLIPTDPVLQAIAEKESYDIHKKSGYFWGNTKASHVDLGSGITLGIEALVGVNQGIGIPVSLYDPATEETYGTFRRSEPEKFKKYNFRGNRTEKNYRRTIHGQQLLNGLRVSNIEHTSKPKMLGVKIFYVSEILAHFGNIEALPGKTRTLTQEQFHVGEDGIPQPTGKKREIVQEYKEYLLPRYIIGIDERGFAREDPDILMKWSRMRPEEKLHAVVIPWPPVNGISFKEKWDIYGTRMYIDRNGQPIRPYLETDGPTIRPASDE